MQRMFQWFAAHRFVNLLVVIGYVVFIVFAHEWFVNLSVEVMNDLSLPVYNRLVASITALIGGGLVLLVVRAFRQKVKVEKVGLVFLIATLCGLVIHFFVFTEMNIEFIHAMEFGLLAMILLPLVRRFGAAIVVSLPVMLFDEWYQYIVLYPDYVDYFDFNDIVLDIFGAGLFLSLVKVFGWMDTTGRLIFKRPEFFLIWAVIILSSVLFVAAIVVNYPDQVSENTWLILNTIEEPYGFWRVHPLIGSTYHVLEPFQGLILVIGLCFGYLAMDPIRSEK